jgi:ATP-dependent RNA helicase DOB1
MDSIKEQLVEVTYSWCNGHTFEEICKMTDSFEGSIIRTLRRLDELLKQMDNAAKVIGNQVLII